MAAQESSRRSDGYIRIDIDVDSLDVSELDDASGNLIRQIRQWLQERTASPAESDDGAVLQVLLGSLQEAFHAQYYKAVWLYAQAILQLDAESSPAHAALGIAKLQLGDERAGIAAVEQAVVIDPRQCVVFNGVALKYHADQNGRQACQWYQRLQDAGAESVEMHNNWALALQAMGKFDEAEAHFVQAIRLDPEEGAIRSNRAHAKQYRSDNPQDCEELAELRQKLARASGNPDQRAGLHMAIGKILDDFGQYNEAFSHWQSGNSLVDTSDYNVQQEMSAVAVAAQHAPALFGQHPDVGDPTHAPVFIVGMPRSGTTLLHQMLKQHPAIAGAGEYKCLARDAHRLAVDRHTTTDESALLKAMAEDYVGGLPEQCRQAERFVDKYPENFMCVALLRLLFPNAKIIHCQRHPLDTCLSNYFMHFQSGHEYSYDLQTLGLYYSMYQDIMRFYQQIVPDMLSVQYEDVVQQPEAQLRRLYEFCQVDWNPAGLAFHTDQDEIWTGANAQVRRPLYQSSVGRWKHYDKHLGPLKEALGFAGDD